MTSIQHLRNDALRLLEFADRRFVNCVRFNVGNTIEHELKKFKICWELKKQGKHFICEAQLLGKKGRIDIFVLDDCLAIEVLCSETVEECREKCKDWPVDYKMVQV